MTTGTHVVTIDPVCGMQVQSGKEAGNFAFKGKTYLFCSKHCLQAFSAEPERYLGKQESAGSGHAAHSAHAHAIVKPVAAPAAAGARYTCPMHPEIRSPKPGSRRTRGQDTNISRSRSTTGTPTRSRPSSNAGG